MEATIDDLKKAKEMWEWTQDATSMRGFPYRIYTTDSKDTIALYITGSRIVIAYNGSDNSDEWVNNFKAFPPLRGVHRGFLESVKCFIGQLVCDIVSIRKDGLQNGIVYTIEQAGHSRGAAMSSVAELLLREAGFGGITTYTFGSPRVFTKHGLKRAKSEGVNTISYRANKDIVDGLPPRWLICSWHHAPGYVVELPTVKGKFDHLAFGEALDAKIKEMENGK